MMIINKRLIASLAFLLGLGVCYSQRAESSFEGGEIPRSLRKVLERKGYKFQPEAGQASAFVPSPAPKFAAPLIQINTGTASGFGIGNYPYWEIGKDVRSISVQPGGFVLGFVSKYPIRLNTQTGYDYDLADWYLNPQDINASMILDNGRGEIVSCGSFVDASSPTWVHRYHSSDFTFISSMTIQAISNKIRVIEDMVFSPSGDIFISGAIWTHTFIPTPFIKKISSDFSSTIDYEFHHSGEVAGMEFGSNGVLFAGGYIDNIGDDSPNVWIAKFDSSLNLIKETTYGSSPEAEDLGFGLGLGSNNDVYIAGMVSEKPWIGRFNENLDYISGSIFSDVPADGYGWFDEVEVVNNGVYITGRRGPYPETETDMLMVEYTKGLSLKSRYILGVSDGFFDSGRSIDSDGQGHIYIGGYINSTGVSNHDHSGKGWLSIHTFNMGMGSPDGKPLAYPNPFRPGKGHTALSIDNLPETGTLKLFTLKGELVREIPVAAGSASWDVKNTAGENVSSGVYFGVVDGQDSDKTFKVVIQR